MSNRHLRDLTASNESLKKELQEARRRLQQRGRANQAKAAWVPLTDEQPKEEEETWFATYLDMMTLLLVLMLVMLAFAGSGEGTGQDGGGLQGRLQSVFSGGAGVLPGAQKVGDGTGIESGQMGEEGGVGALGEHTLTHNNQAWQHLDLSALGDDIDVILEEEAVSFRINSEILFSSGQADLSLAGLTVLKKLVPIFKQNDMLITVEGHTDSVPIRSARFPSNWELSGARAGSVVRYLEANGIDSSRLRAVGYADTRPIDDNSHAAGRANNRRVELSIAVSPEAVLPTLN